MSSHEINPNPLPTEIYPPGSSLMEAADVARWLGVSEQWVRDHGTKREPRLKSVRIGRLLRFRHEDVQEFIARCRR